VGTAPTTGTTTTVPTVLIPVKLVLGSTTTDPLATTTSGRTVVATTEASPLFQSGVTVTQGGTAVGTTQYVDAWTRASFWGQVATEPGQHLLLGQPTVEPERTFTVPSGQGTTASAFGVKVIVADLSWFDGQARAALAALGLPADSLPIFVTTQDYLSENTGLSGCCVGGYHSFTGAQAYAEFSFIQSPTAFAADVAALSHELGEWADDPFVDNTDVPRACKDGIFEVGDPLEGEAGYGTTAYALGGVTYHLQDLVTPEYFGAPATTSVHGWSTFQGTRLAVCQNG
jgi:hypothetical protein